MAVVPVVKDPEAVVLERKKRKIGIGGYDCSCAECGIGDHCMKHSKMCFIDELLRRRQ